jgi:hypothetical protein
MFIEGTPVCASCDQKEKAGEHPRGSEFDEWPEVGTRLAVARNEYRIALWVQREALARRHTLDQNSSSGSRALHEANVQLAKAAAKYDEALGQFMAEQASRRRAS